MAILIASGKYPRIEHGPNGDAYFMAFLAASSTIQVCVKHPGSASWSSPVTITDSTGAALLWEDAGLDVSEGYSPQTPLVLFATAHGDTGPSEWVAGDGGLTWTRVS